MSNLDSDQYTDVDGCLLTPFRDGDGFGMIIGYGESDSDPKAVYLSAQYARQLAKWLMDTAEKAENPDAVEKWYRIDDGRADETFVVQATSRAMALEELLECCASNASVTEADEHDLENYGPGSGNGWFQS